MNPLKALSTPLLLSSAVVMAADTGQPSLKHFETKKIDGHRTLIEMEAAHTNNYFIRVDRWPHGARLPGFIVRSGFFVYAPVEANTNLVDNGPLDENSAEDKFSITLNTTDWLPGEYVLRVGAKNRSGSGAYRDDARYVTLKVGDAPARPKSNVEGAVHRVVWEDPALYACFPSLFTFPDGRLGLWFHTKSTNNHLDNKGGSRSLISTDQGETWAPAEEPLIDRRWLTGEGTLVEATAQGHVYVSDDQEEELRRQGRNIERVRPGVIAYQGGAVKRMSSDSGRNWTRDEIALPDDCAYLNVYLMAASQLTTRKGTRISAVYGKRKPSEANGKPSPGEVYLLRSEDDGKSWSCKPMHPTIPASRTLGFNETALVQAGDGSLIALMRSSAEDALWQAVSTDDGLSWSEPVRTPMEGYPAHAIRLKDGRLICAYGRRDAPMGIRAAMSRDDGKTWDLKNELIIRDDAVGGRGDVGYPQLFERADGGILAIYYMSDTGGMPYIGSTLFMLP